MTNLAYFNKKCPKIILRSSIFLELLNILRNIADMRSNTEAKIYLFYTYQLQLESWHLLLVYILVRVPSKVCNSFILCRVVYPYSCLFIVGSVNKYGYTLICNLVDLKEREGLKVKVNSKSLAVFKVGENVHIIKNSCAHQAIPLDGSYFLSFFFFFFFFFKYFINLTFSWCC